MANIDQVSIEEYKIAKATCDLFIKQMHNSEIAIVMNNEQVDYLLEGLKPSLKLVSLCQDQEDDTLVEQAEQAQNKLIMIGDWFNKILCR